MSFENQNGRMAMLCRNTEWPCSRWERAAAIEEKQKMLDGSGWLFRFVPEEAREYQVAGIAFVQVPVSPQLLDAYFDVPHLHAVVDQFAEKGFALDDSRYPTR